MPGRAWRHELEKYNLNGGTTLFRLGRTVAPLARVGHLSAFAPNVPPFAPNAPPFVPDITPFASDVALFPPDIDRFARAFYLVALRTTVRTVRVVVRKN